MPTQAERTEATRGALVAAGRRLFGARGYASVGTEEIVAAAGVTRGALYHHFRDKRDLFRAVFIDSETAFVQRVGESVAGVEDPYELLVAALEATLDACTDRELARIAFLDGPAVLGYEDWRSIVDGYSLALLTTMLTQAMEAGALRRTPVEPLAHLVSGALNEAGMVIATGGDRDEVGTALRALLEGLRA
jgi:AcrR family transcriptional regulator